MNICIHIDKSSIIKHGLVLFTTCNLGLKSTLLIFPQIRVTFFMNNNHETVVTAGESKVLLTELIQKGSIVGDTNVNYNSQNLTYYGFL